MSILDWSDPEQMVGLLAEYIRDELLDERQDRERLAFLRRLSAAVGSLASRADSSSTEMLARLRHIHDSQPPEFAADPVLVHIGDCIHELERIRGESPPDSRPR